MFLSKSQTQLSKQYLDRKLVVNYNMFKINVTINSIRRTDKGGTLRKSSKNKGRRYILLQFLFYRKETTTLYRHQSQVTFPGTLSFILIFLHTNLKRGR